MSERYPIPADRHRAEIEVRRSRFVATSAPATTLDEARTFLETIRTEFPDATHNCWAYLVGPPGRTDRVGMSDDGEPHGTAGRPMLNVLQHSGIGDIAVVVTRYYGGNKLGRGGLVRAYGEAVQAVLEDLPTAEHCIRVARTIVLDYAGVDALDRLMPTHEATTVDRRFSDRVETDVELPEDNLDGFTDAVREMSNGTAVVR